MRGFLYVAFGFGCLLVVGGVIDRLGLQNAMTTQPAIVVMPQVIAAWLVAGFGLVTAAVSAGGLAICTTLEALKLNPQIVVNTPPRGTPPEQKLAPRPAGDLPKPAAIGIPCPQCGVQGAMIFGKCAACGFDKLSGKGAHGA